MSDYSFLTTIVQEKHIIKDIIEYKKQFEYAQKIERFNHDWQRISRTTLTEDFMLVYKNELNWAIISEFQYMSDKFIEENEEQLSKLLLARNKKISEEKRNKYLKYAFEFYLNDAYNNNIGMMTSRYWNFAINDN
jgi:hypothetical protein